MKTPPGLALLVLVASAATAFAQLPDPPRPPQLPDPRPDLAIGVTTSAQRVGVGETFTYAVTARNGGRAPCNWINLTLKLPGEVDLASPSSSGPLACSTAIIRIVGEPFDVACKGGPGFFLWPGNTVTANIFVKGLRPASNVTATAVADPDNVCFESNENNNRATSAGITIIQRPSLKMTLNKPFAPPTPSGRGPVSQIFPVTITNTGAGPASDIALVVQQSFIVPGATYNGPEIDIAYKGERLAEGHVPTNPIPPSCGTASAGGVLTRTCILHIGLQPGELLQVHYRAPPCGGTTVVAVPDIRVSTADDLTQTDHVVNLHRACAF